MIREALHYRREIFDAGLRAAGYTLHQRIADPRPGDCLVVWNRYAHWHDECCRFEKAGASVLIAENSPIKELVDGKRFTLARSYHNDATTVSSSGPERWSALGIDLMPWRTSGEHVLVCPNRSFGTPGRIMPREWGVDVSARLAKLTRREVRLRPHPGNKPPVKPLADDLAGAWCVVIWSSSTGVQSLVAGIPVICEAPYWIAKGAASARIENVDCVDRVVCPETRLQAMQRLAWAVWSAEEIGSGEAFRRLLQCES